MTKQKWLVALLVGSSIGCFCGADQSPAQSLSGLKYRLQVLPNEAAFPTRSASIIGTGFRA
jgi:hypothetical protein